MASHQCRQATSLQRRGNDDRRHPRGVQGRHADRPATGADVSRPDRRLRQERPGDQRASSRSIPRAGRSRPARCGVQGVGLRRPAARHSGHHEGPGRRQGHADDARLGAVQGLHARPRLLRRRQAEKGRRRSSSARRPWASSAAATPTARCSARRATSTTSSAPPAVPRAARAPASRPISAPSPSARKASRRSAGRRSGTASPACARPWGWSAAAASTAAGRRSTARSGRWRAPSPISRSSWTAWSATIPTIRSPLTASARRPTAIRRRSTRPR